MIGFYFKNHTKQINTTCAEKNAEILFISGWHI